MIEEIPDDILAMVRRAVARLSAAQQALRYARDYATCIAGTGVGEVDRAEFLVRRSRSGVTVAEIRENRGYLRQFVAVAAENGIDGNAVVRQAWGEHRAWCRANPSGRFYECRRVRREMADAKLAGLAPLPKVGFNARDRRYGYNVRDRLPLAVLPNARTMSLREYRCHAARAIKARRAAKAEAERREAKRQAILDGLRVRGKQTPEREERAKKIRDARGLARLGMFGTPKAIRKHYLDQRRKRLSPISASIQRLIERCKEAPWFAGAVPEDGTIVILATDLRAAKRDADGVDQFEGKPIVLRKMPRKKTPLNHPGPERGDQRRWMTPEKP